MASVGPFINIVGMRCRPEDEAKFDNWYSHVHLPLVRHFKGLQSITRYKLAPDNDRRAYPRFLSIFTFACEADFKTFLNSPEVAAAKAEMDQTWADGSFEIVWRVQYEAVPPQAK
jgi:uncharacterized protein (TIGR02118 family)